MDGNDVVPEFERKDGGRRGGSSLLLRGRRLIQVVHTRAARFPSPTGVAPGAKSSVRKAVETKMRFSGRNDTLRTFLGVMSWV